MKSNSYGEKIAILRATDFSCLILTDEQRNKLIEPTKAVVDELEARGVNEVPYYRTYIEELENYPFFSVLNLRSLLIEQGHLLQTETFTALYDALTAL